ncbi:hypothetical protein [Leptonema illini]|uniref:hypothetical protein n=1 Tax=Leptonema illini TaxID=183 RepID=UPI0003018FD6|nr:hypothetical protein [Leptonema illini]
MSKKYRAILLIISLILLLIISFTVKGSIIPPVQDFWFSSGILLLILLSLIDQPHFSKDANIFINAATAAVSLLLINKTDRDWIFWSFVYFILYLFASSYFLIWLRNNPLNEENKYIQLFSRINRNLGKPSTIFSAFFLWGAIKQFGLNSNETIALFWYWFAFMLFNAPSIAKIIESFFDNKIVQINESSIGSIFGVQSKKMFLTKLFEQRKSISKFDIVHFRYSMQDSNDLLVRGIVFDTYLLNEAKWAKILQLDIVKDTNENLAKNIVHLVSPDEKERIAEELSVNRFIGIITEGSGIGKIKFEYSKKQDNLQEGDLIELTVANRRLFYQVINGFTTIMSRI